MEKGLKHGRNIKNDGKNKTTVNNVAYAATFDNPIFPVSTLT